MTSPRVAELPVGQSERHGVQRPADEEHLPASSFYEAIMPEHRFSSPSISFQMPGSNSDLAVGPHVTFEQYLCGCAFGEGCLAKQEHGCSPVSNAPRA